MARFECDRREPLYIPMPAATAGCEKVVVKRTFLEVVDDSTPKSLPASYNSDSVLVRPLTRLISDGRSSLAPTKEELEELEDTDDDDNYNLEALEEDPNETSGASELSPQCRMDTSSTRQDEEDDLGTDDEDSERIAEVLAASDGQRQASLSREQSYLPAIKIHPPAPGPSILKPRPPSFQRSSFVAPAPGQSQCTSPGADDNGRIGSDGRVKIPDLQEPSAAALNAISAAAVTAATAALDAAGISKPALAQLMEQQQMAAARAPPMSQTAPRKVDLSCMLPELPPPRRERPAIEKRGSAPKTAPGQPRTTIMLRNLPNNYTRAMVCTMMDKEGFRGQYDFLYLPIDFRSKANLGYAFVNLVEESQVQRFWSIFNGYAKWVLPSSKVCHVSWSGPHQGQKAHVDRYRDSPIMHGSVPDEYKPVVFEAGTGLRKDFPPPSKKLRAPRRRVNNGNDATAS